MRGEQVQVLPEWLSRTSTHGRSTGHVCIVHTKAGMLITTQQGLETGGCWGAGEETARQAAVGNEAEESHG